MLHPILVMGNVHKHLHVYVRGGLRVRVCVRVHVQVHVHMCTCAHVHMCICAYVHMCICAYARIHAHAHIMLCNVCATTLTTCVLQTTIKFVFDSRGKCESEESEEHVPVC